MMLAVRRDCYKQSLMRHFSGMWVYNITSEDGRVIQITKLPIVLYFYLDALRWEPKIQTTTECLHYRPLKRREPSNMKVWVSRESTNNIRFFQSCAVSLLDTYIRSNKSA